MLNPPPMIEFLELCACAVRIKGRHALNTDSYVQEVLINTGSLFLIGPSSTEHEQDSCSFQLCCTSIYRTVPSSTRENTVVANATTKKVNEQDTKIFPKCYVGRNGKQNQQKLHNCSRHNGIKGATEQ